MRYGHVGITRALVFVMAIWPTAAGACGNGDASGVDGNELLLLYERFKSCRGLADSAAVSCVAETTASDTSARLNQKIARWLLEADSLGPLEDCPHEVVRLFPRARASEFVAIRCVSYRAFGRDDQSLFYFVEEGGKLKIAGVQKQRL